MVKVILPYKGLHYKRPCLQKKQEKEIKKRVYYQKLGLKKNPVRMLFIQSQGLARVEELETFPALL